MKNLADELNNLDPNNPGVWPLPFQLALIAIVFVILLYAGYYFDISKQRVELESITAKEQEFKETFERKQRKAANLKALKEQMQEMEQSFGDMIRQLPNRAEVAGLIIDISQTGLAAGLEFDLFQPKGEQPSEFYSAIPIAIQVRGSYHQLGEFISGIASLPRIVTTHSIRIKKGKGGGLQMAATAKTYRALEEES